MFLGVVVFGVCAIAVLAGGLNGDDEDEEDDEEEEDDDHEHDD